MSTQLAKLEKLLAKFGLHPPKQNGLGTPLRAAHLAHLSSTPCPRPWLRHWLLPLLKRVKVTLEGDGDYLGARFIHMKIKMNISNIP